MTSTNKGWSSLPVELHLHILDFLVESSTPHHQDHQPVALPPNHPTTRTLLALTRVSRIIYPLASSYLYANCLCINNEPSFARLYRTLSLHSSADPQLSQNTEPRRDEELWKQVDVLRHVNRAFLSPAEDKTEGEECFAAMMQFPHVVDVFAIIGAQLKRLVLVLSHEHISQMRDTNLMNPKSRLSSYRNKKVFPSMPLLEEAVINFDSRYTVSSLSPQLKRLCTTVYDEFDCMPGACFSIPSLETLVLLRPKGLAAVEIDAWFYTYQGESLDVILVDVNSNHLIPWLTRNFKEDDKVRIWEVDVPTSFYGDDDDIELCTTWIFEHARDGSLWETEKRRMEEPQNTPLISAPYVWDGIARCGNVGTPPLRRPVDVSRERPAARLPRLSPYELARSVGISLPPPPPPPDVSS